MPMEPLELCTHLLLSAIIARPLHARLMSRFAAVGRTPRIATAAARIIVAVAVCVVPLGGGARASGQRGAFPLAHAAVDEVGARGAGRARLLRREEAAGVQFGRWIERGSTVPGHLASSASASVCVSLLAPVSGGEDACDFAATDFDGCLAWESPDT